MTLTDTREPDSSTAPLPARPPRPKLTATQVLASALAAVTATVAASFLGVTGTVIGAALASVITVVGNALYGHSLARTSERVRAVVPVPANRWSDGKTAPTRVVAVPAPARAAVRRSARAGRFSVKNVALACVAVFATLSVILTGIELATGKPLADLVRGSSGHGTTFFGDGGSNPGTTPAPAPTGSSSTGTGSSASTGATSGSGSGTTPTPTTTVTTTTTTTVSPSPSTSAPTAGTGSGSGVGSGAASSGAAAGATPVP